MIWSWSTIYLPFSLTMMFVDHEVTVIFHDHFIVQLWQWSTMKSLAWSNHCHFIVNCNQTDNSWSWNHCHGQIIFTSLSSIIRPTTIDHDVIVMVKTLSLLIVKHLKRKLVGYKIISKYLNKIRRWNEIIAIHMTHS